MAKESMKAREVKRAKLVAKYAAKRAALKEIVNKSNDPVEAYEAARKLQKIPRNANPIRLHNRCKITGRGRYESSSDPHVAYNVSWLHELLRFDDR
jgi:small subunit ribosomal protein S14